MKYNFIIFIIISLFLLGCNAEFDDVLVSGDGENGLLEKANAVPGYVKINIEGIYEVKEGQKEFGKDVVIKWSDEYLTIFTGKNAAFLILKSGELDSSFYFEGYWRYAQGSESGYVSLKIDASEGGYELIQGLSNENIILNGFIGVGNAVPNKKVTFHYKRQISKKRKEFWIIGHRGGGRNADRFGASENSLEMIRLSERLGCNAIEIDVKVTADNVPILFHDSKLSLRLIREKYMIGKVSEYDWQTLRSFCTLKNGEKIPTLREALETVVYETNLKLVWLDIKAFNILKDIVPIQMEYMQRAIAAGRDLEILLGLPDEVIFANYLALENYKDYPSLCEFSYEQTLKEGCDIWAPRWSIGVSEEQRFVMSSNEKRIFTWTLDEPKFIKTFIDKDIFDGILSNFPMLVAYEYYIKEED